MSRGCRGLRRTPAMCVRRVVGMMRGGGVLSSIVVIPGLADPPTLLSVSTYLAYLPYLPIYPSLSLPLFLSFYLCCACVRDE